MIKLDHRDIEILCVLAREGRVSKAVLAEKINLSATPAWERLKKLEKHGLVTRYCAEFNLRKLGPHVTLFVAAELTDHTAASFQRFERALDHHDEVVGCWALGGGFDYLLHIITRDIEAYQTLIDTMLDARIGIARYFTYIVTKQVKGPCAPPFALLAGQSD